ncbi:MAG: hypothetical protein WDO17_19125 [Alphaproteobacteria bacterium]
MQTLLKAQPKLLEFLGRFTDAFGVKLNPAILIVREDLFAKLRTTNAIPSFRDILVASVIPYSRALTIVYRTGNRVCYSASFWLYPWMVGNDLGHMTMHTPALTAFHIVDEFGGQSMPEVPDMQLEARDLDKVLFDALMKRWRRHYIGNRQTWEDRALFRSLNMVAQATQLPGGSDVTFYDLCRNAALWVGAFEMLTHPRKGNSGLQTVYALLERVFVDDKNLKKQRYVAYMGRAKKPWPRRILPCWLYGRLYILRNKYLHGNPISKNLLDLKGSEHGLFWMAAPLYRFALYAFLRMRFRRKMPPPSKPKAFGRYIADRMTYRDSQDLVERALLRARNRPQNKGTP